MAQQFRKLNIDLPRQPLSDQKAWTFVGWLLAAIIIMIIAISYISYINNQDKSVAKAHYENSNEYFVVNLLNL